MIDLLYLIHDANCKRSPPVDYVRSEYHISFPSMVSGGSSAASHRSVEILASKLRRRLVNLTLAAFRCIHLLNFRQIVGSRATALETLLVLRQVISKARFSNFEQLVGIIRDVGRRLVDAQPKGL
jgi:translation initiation factor eIF-2B subunit beta